MHIAKSNGKLPLLHILCPVWTLVHSIWSKMWEKTSRLDTGSMFSAQRREEAILVCEIAGVQSHSRGWSTFDTLRDVTRTR